MLQIFITEQYLLRTHVDNEIINYIYRSIKTYVIEYMRDTTCRFFKLYLHNVRESIMVTFGRDGYRVCPEIKIKIGLKSRSHNFFWTLCICEPSGHQYYRVVGYLKIII